MFRKSIITIALLSSVAYGLRADINGDGRVDLQDLAILSEEWLMANKHLHFNGTDGYVTVPDDNALDLGTGDFTICVWVKTTDTQFYVCNKRVVAHGWFLACLSSKLIFQVSSPGALWNYNVDSSNVTTGNWVHVSCVKDNTGIIIYLNATTNIPTDVSYDGGTPDDSTGAELTIGKNPIGNFLSGSLDDLRIYKGKALTPEEVAIIYNGGIGKKYDTGDVADATAVLAFDFDEGSGNPQSKGVVLTGTITGGVTWESGGVPLSDRNPLVSGTITAPGRSKNVWCRARGVYAAVRLSNDTLDETFGLERITCTVLPAGKTK